MNERGFYVYGSFIVHFTADVLLDQQLVFIFKRGADNFNLFNRDGLQNSIMVLFKPPFIDFLQ